MVIARALCNLFISYLRYVFDKFSNDLPSRPASTSTPAATIGNDSFAQNDDGNDDAVLEPGRAWELELLGGHLLADLYPSSTTTDPTVPTPMVLRLQTEEGSFPIGEDEADRFTTIPPGTFYSDLVLLEQKG